jgi:Ca2+-binding EF-hand superfamily protein
MGSDSIRDEVAAAGEPIPSGEALKALANKFNEHVDRIVPPDEVGTWFKIFKDFDVDFSGMLTFDELEDGVRNRLHMKTGELSEIGLKALWCAIDADDSGFVESSEFHKFMDREENVVGRIEKRQEMMRQKSMKARRESEAHHDQEAHDQKLFSQISTQELRKELEAHGRGAPTEEEKNKMAVQFAKWIFEYTEGDGHQSIAWLKIFKQVGAGDDTGLITYDQLRLVIRRTFKVGAKTFSEDQIKELWCVLDEDNSDSICNVEFGRFMRRAQREEKKKPTMLKKQSTFSANMGAYEDMKRQSEALRPLTPPKPKEIRSTEEIRAEVLKRGETIPTGEKLKAIANKFNEHIDRIVPPDQAGTWFKIFKDFDRDFSGMITFDELEDGVRNRLHMKAHELSDIRLKALWCAIDADDSGFVESSEFHTFMDREESLEGKEEKRQRLLRQKSMNARKEYEEHKDKEQHDQKLFSQISTQELRKELEAHGRGAPTEEEKNKMAVQFLKWIFDYTQGDGHQGIAWLKIFKQVGAGDDTGLITYDQLRLVIRRVFKITSSGFSEDQIKELWCVLDEDNSDSICNVEFGRFMRRAQREEKKKPTIGLNRKERFGTNMDLKKSLDKSALVETPKTPRTPKPKENHGKFIKPSTAPKTPRKKQSTAEIRAELEALGEPIPSGEALRALSRMFNKKIDRIVPPDQAGTWFKIFKDFDKDFSGMVMFDELEEGIRDRLWIRERDLPDLKLKALWCAIDADDSGFVESSEFHTFMGREESLEGKEEKRQRLLREKSMKARKEYEEHKDKELHDEGLFSKVSTRAIRSELEAKGVALPSEEEQTEMAKRFQSWTMELPHLKERDPSIAWLIVFKEMDDDSSGLMTYDELRAVIRRTFKVGAKTFSEDQIKELWCVLDEDDSDHINLVEFGRFMKWAIKKKASKAINVTAVAVTPGKRFSPGGPQPTTPRTPRDPHTGRPLGDVKPPSWKKPADWNKHVWALTGAETNFCGGPWVSPRLSPPRRSPPR